MSIDLCHHNPLYHFIRGLKFLQIAVQNGFLKNTTPYLLKCTALRILTFRFKKLAFLVKDNNAVWWWHLNINYDCNLHVHDGSNEHLTFRKTQFLSQVH